MEITVLLFGRLAEIAGHDRVRLEHVTDTTGLKQALHGKYPGLASVKYRIAVNRKMVDENTRVDPGSTIALLPPFSGG